MGVPLESGDADDRAARRLRRAMRGVDAARADGDAIVGQLWVQAIEKIPNPAAELERHAYVSNLFVQPAHRGGAGTGLLEAALAWARANEVDRVILWPSSRSVPLYERHGFTRRGTVMELMLESTAR